MMANNSPGFRKALSDELPEWDFLTDEQVLKIRTLYELDAIAEDASSKLASIIFMIGALLIGCGVFAFVAYHWEEMSREARMAILLFAMATSHAVGFLLKNTRRPRLGHALIVLGTLIFYASIGLIEQMFHISTSDRGWGLTLYFGAMAIALAAKSTPNFLIACAGLFATIMDSNPNSSLLLPLHIVLVIGYVLLTRSKISLTAGYFLTAALAFNILDPFLKLEKHFFSFAIFFAVLAPILSAILDRTMKPNPFRGILTGIGIFITAAAAYSLSFEDIARDIGSNASRSPIVDAVIGLGAVAILFAVNRRYLLIAIPCAILILIQYSGVPAIVAANGVALYIGGWSLKSGIDRASSLSFWFGLLFILLVIISRNLEYETGLLMKSLAFIASGVAVIMGGIFFEGRKR